MQIIKKEVVKKNIRNYAYYIAQLWLGKKPNMSKQAKTLSAQDIRRVLDYMSTRPHAARNRAMFLTMAYAGLRVGETAALTYANVMEADGSIRKEIYLAAEQTKGRYGRTVFVNEKLCKELHNYVTANPPQHQTAKGDKAERLFYTQKKAGAGFSANTLTQHFHYLYRRVGIAGASSHSCRRTFITNLAAKGVGVRVLMALAGHRNIGTTQAYIDINDTMKRAAVELV